MPPPLLRACSFVILRLMILKLPVSLLVLLCFLSLLHCFAGQTISSVAPNVGAPGSRITVTGTGFTCSASRMTATIGSLQTSSISVVSSSSMTMLMPTSGTGVFLDLVLTFTCFSPNRQVTSNRAVSYIPSMVSVVPSTLDSARTAILTVSGANFASPCSSATITVVGTGVAAVCSVSSTTRLTLTLTTPELNPGNPVTVQVPFAANINTVTTSKSFSILLRPPSPPTPNTSSVTPSPDSSGTPSYVIALSVLGGLGALMTCIYGCLVARKNGWCSRKGHMQELRYERPPAYAPDNPSYFPHSNQPQAPRPKTIERDMATAPPSDSVEVEWAGYMAEYDGRRQQHIGPVNAAGALPQRLDPYALGAVVEMEHAASSGAGQPQWAGYMAAYDARLQGHISPEARGYPSAPPATDSELAYNQAVGHDRL